MDESLADEDNSTRAGLGRGSLARLPCAASRPEVSGSEADETRLIHPKGVVLGEGMDPD